MTSETDDQVRHHARVLEYHDTGSPGFGDVCQRFAEHFRDQVPDRGPADTLEGQVLLAVGRLSGEWRRNGNINWGSRFEHYVETLRDALLSEAALESRHGGIQADLDGVVAHGRGDGFPHEALRGAFGRLIEDAVVFVEAREGGGADAARSRCAP